MHEEEAPAIKITLSDEDHRVLRDLQAAGLGTKSQIVAAALRVYQAEQEATAHPLALSWDDWFAALKGLEGKLATVASPNSAQYRIHLFDSEDSYEAEIDNCRELFRGAGSFEEMELADREHVGGWGDSTGFLGNMNAAAPFKVVVRKRPEWIGEWLDQIPLYGEVSEEDERRILAGLLGVRGVGLASMTRLLSAKRPDLYVPVNMANIENVNASLRTVRNNSVPHRLQDYLFLLQQIRSFPWYRSPRPRPGQSSRKERFAWGARAALLDAFLYARDGVPSGEE